MAFKICTVLQNADVAVVCTGGSAATIYAPHAYQSLDIDFVLQFNPKGLGAGAKALQKLGYADRSGVYFHTENPFTIDFLDQPLSIGGDSITTWRTLKQKGMVLNILSPTDSCRDRLAHFIFWNDRAALSQAVAIAIAQKVDLDVVGAWCAREGQDEKFRQFQRELGNAHGH